MTKEESKLLFSVIEYTLDTESTPEIISDYSGRGMNGKETYAISTDDGSFLDIVRAIGEGLLDATSSEVVEIGKILNKINVDDFGFGTVIY